MRDLEQQSDAELLSTIGQAQAILNRRQRERGHEFQRVLRGLDAEETRGRAAALADARQREREALAPKAAPLPDSDTGGKGA